MEISEENKLKIKVQKCIVSVSVILLAGKFFAFYLTNSVGILTDAMESIVNVVAGFISFFSLRMSAQPRDKEHPFGHGKIELISASIEGILIFIAGLLIIIEGVKRLVDPSFPDKLDIGIIVVTVAGIVNYILGWYSIRVGRKHNSIALIAGGKHLQSDTYSTIGLVTGLLILYFTHIAWIDSLLALIFGGIIMITGVGILSKTTANLLDQADEEMLSHLSSAIDKDKHPEWIDLHNLKTIKYGSTAFIDCDLTLPWYYTIEQGHDSCEKLKEVIEKQLTIGSIVSIHSDSCACLHCEHCLLSNCQYRKSEFVKPLTFSIKEITESDEERDVNHGL